MAKLVAKSPADGLLPVAHGGVTLSELAAPAITSVQPFAGQTGKVSDALDEQFSAPFPAAGQAYMTEQGQVIWAGLNEALVVGPGPELVGAAVTDQSDAWTALVLSGDLAGEILTRLTPLDLRLGSFGVGQSARSLLGHMSCLFVRTKETQFEMFVFRSLAATAVHEIEGAMKSVTAHAAQD